MTLPRVKLLAVLATALVLAGCPSTPRPVSPTQAGEVHFLKRTGPADNGFFENPAHRDFIRSHFDRASVFRPYFDQHVGWYRGGLVYRNAYGVFPGDADDNDQWILRDGFGRKLFIPYSCSGGRCAQYAADVGDPYWRADWIAEAKDDLARGYGGLWIDDVNLEWRVGDGSGNFVTPIDDRTGRAMTYDAWRRYMAEFMEQIRREIPQAMLLHNSIWYAGNSVGRWRDPYVSRQLKAADWINLERGAIDEGLTGGSGEFSLRRLLEFVDVVHFNGKWAVWDQVSDAQPASLEYNLATYFLTNRGLDGVGAPNQTPSSWWPGFDVSLGAPKGGRYDWSGFIRRDFERGMVLVNEPGSPSRAAVLGRPMRTTSGQVVSQVPMPTRSGVVLRDP